MDSIFDIDLKALHDKIGDNATAFGYRVVHTSENDTDYYDLIDPGVAMIACDGETCYRENRVGKWNLINNQSEWENDICFSLSDEEYAIVCHE